MRKAYIKYKLFFLFIMCYYIYVFYLGGEFMNIYITRHGKTDWNLQKKIQGSTNISINEEGIKEAEILKEKLKDVNIDLIISSSLKRAIETSEIINEGKNAEIIVDDRIRERSYGIHEGSHKDDFDFIEFWDYNKNVKVQDAETIKDLFDRVYSFLDDIKEKYYDKNVLLVTHSGTSVVIKCYLNNYDPTNDLFQIQRLSNCEVEKYSI